MLLTKLPVEIDDALCNVRILGGREQEHGLGLLLRELPQARHRRFPEDKVR